MTPVDVVRRWFEAWARRDLDDARALLCPGACVAVFGAEPVSLRGFDEFVAWYDERRRQRPDFAYRVEDLLGGEHHAAAVITLTAAGRERRQVAVYRVEGGRIAELRAYEEPASRPSATRR